MTGSNGQWHGTLRDCSKARKDRKRALARASQGLPLEIWGTVRRGIMPEIKAASTYLARKGDVISCEVATHSKVIEEAS